MTSPHTPGPWRVGFDDGSGTEYVVAGERSGGDARSIAKVRWGCGCCEDRSPLTPKEAADARLIAAAPALLAALKEITVCVFTASPEERKGQHRECERIARAAIARAEGK